MADNIPGNIDKEPENPESTRGDTQILIRERPKLKKPNKYRVVLLNDDYTPMEFVVWLLIKVFHHPEDQATRLMMDVHQKGRGVCGVYTHDIAQTKVFQVQALAEENQHPLQSVMEAVDAKED